LALLWEGRAMKPGRPSRAANRVQRAKVEVGWY
jgi:hypothetical protein